MPAKVRYGVIGCGMMGQEHLRNIALLPDTEVTVIFNLRCVRISGSMKRDEYVL